MSQQHEGAGGGAGGGGLVGANQPRNGMSGGSRHDGRSERRRERKTGKERKRFGDFEGRCRIGNAGGASLGGVEIDFTPPMFL